ncbi:UPF0764 protein C16orf89 homolog isoform X2 [Lineus longissimus]|uniref:UPF0764 protein C16orf89 homolog isoform X2 n=1 Tax=Lineus longissimus TaxID=88925 RepID=UPI00315C63F9
MVSQRRATQAIFCIFFTSYVAFFLFIRKPTDTDDPLTDSPPDDTLTRDVLNSLVKLLNNIGANYRDLNVDGLFGLRITQGQIYDAFVEASKGYVKITPTIHKKVEEVVNQLNKLGDASFKNLMETGSAYSQEFRPLLSGALNVTGGYLHVNTGLPEVKFDEEFERNMMVYNESMGDACMTSLIGTLQDKTKRSFPKCTVTQECVDYMLGVESKTMTGYGPTHSALYVYVARWFGCEPNVQSHLSTPLVSVLKDICSRSYAEAKILMKANFQFLDVFMETIAICGGMSGFEEFFRKDWWDLISYLQDESGCYKSVVSDDFKKRAENLPQSFHSRKLLWEAIMKNDCSSHTSGVAAGAIGAFARYLIEHNGHFFKEN